MKETVTEICRSIRKGTAMVLALFLCLQGLSLNVYASDVTDEAKSPEIRRVNLNINGKIAGIHDPSAPTDSESEWSNGTGNRIWFGGNTASNLFNVLDCDADDFTQDGRKTLFVESNSYADMGNIIFDKEADNGQSAVSEWKNSDVYRYLNSVPGYGYLTTNFNTVERSVIVDSYNENHAEWTYDDNPFRYASLTGEKIFILDSMEARNEQYGFSSNRYNAKSRSRSKKAWWSRSSDISNSRLAGQVNANGVISSVNASTSKACCYPAMNIDLDSIFFSVAYSGGRPSMITYMESREQDKTWLLTIFDGNKDFDAELGCDSEVYADAPIKIKVNNLGTPQDGVIYDQISGMVVRNDGTVVAYGKIGEIDEDEFAFSLPKGVEPGEYTLKVFAEHAQHGRTTNYTSNESNLHIVVSEKKYAPTVLPDAVIEVENTVRNISEMQALPDGWEWEQKDVELPQNDSVKVKAYYMADDKEDYEINEIVVEIRRKRCLEGHILFSGEEDVLPTCTENGYGHTECTICGDVMRSKIEVDPVGHNWEIEYTVDNEPSCSEEGTKSIHCSICGEKKDICTIDKTEHKPDKPVIENKIEATCIAEGSYDEVTYCIQCGEEITREHKAIERKPHASSEPVSENQIDSNCTERGNYDEVVYCGECGTELSRVQKYLDQTEHIPDQMVVENIIESTCTEEGSYDEVIYCKDCGTEISRTHKVTDMCDHHSGESVTENETESTCREHGHYDEVIYCKDCGIELSRITSEKELKSHSAGEITIENDIAAACLAMGGYDEVSYCEACGIEVSRNHVDIAMTGHNPAEKAMLAT